MRPHRHRLIEPLENRLLMAIIPVLNNENSGAGSLRQAIADAVSGDTIDLTSRFGTIVLSNTQITVAKSLTLIGPGEHELSIHGSDSTRLFDVTSAGALTISNLTLKEGNADLLVGGGGAIRNAGNLTLNRVTISGCYSSLRGGAITHQGANLTLTDCSFFDNEVEARSGSSVRGGAIDIRSGSANINNCLFHNNRAGAISGLSNGNASGGAVAVGLSASATFLNCTFSQNIADATGAIPYTASGGGLHVDSGSVQIFHCTFAYNQTITNYGASLSAASGGGLTIASGVNARLYNCLFKNSSSGRAPDAYIPSPLGVDATGNLLGSPDLVNGLSAAKNDMGADVNFFPLGNNGGPTLTRMPFGQLNNIYWAWGSGFGQDARGYTRSQYGPTAGAIESYTPAQGGFGLALHFDEWYYLDPAQVIISQTPALELQQFTVEAWAKISPAAAIHNPLYSHSDFTFGTAVNFEYLTDAGGRLHLQLGNGSSFLDLYAPLSWDLVQNRWMRFTASWDGSVARIYADGDLIASAAATGTIGYGPNGQARLGSSPDSILYQQWSLTGYLDEVKIWNRVLTAADIYSDNDVNAADTFGLIAAFSFNEPANNDITNLRDDNFGGVLMGEISRVASTVPVRVRIHEDSAVLLYLPNYQLSYESNPDTIYNQIFVPPVHGFATPYAMGNRATYQPQANYFGDDSFEYLPYSAYYETTVSIQIESVNDAPTFTTTALPAAQERADYIATVVASDVEGDPLTITADYLPAWLTLTDNGNDTATLTATAIPTKPGDYVVRLIVSDGTASTMKQFSLHVDPGANRPPAFSTTAPTAATSEQLYQYEIAATDPDNNPLQFLVTGGGDWLTLTDHGDGTATLWGTPTNAHAGPWNITLTVGDGFVKVNQQFTIDVTAINHAPTITFEGTLSAVADTWFHAPYELFDADGDTVTWQIIQDVGWLWPSPTNPTELTGLPSNSDAGDRVLTLRLSDGVQTVDYSFTVHVTAINHAPVLITPFVPSAIGGSNYQFTIAASDPDSDPLSLSATNLPAWLTFTDNGNGTATLSGTPTNANAGDYTFNLQISDGAISTQRTFSLTVARGPNHTPTIEHQIVTWYAHPLGSWDGDFVATDADGDPITFSAIELPSWLKLTDHGDGTARISGLIPDLIGDFTIKLAAGDGETQATYATTITVAPDPDMVTGETLYIWGTNGNDQIEVYPYDNGGGIRVRKNGVITNYRAWPVKKICVYSFDGNDWIAISTGLIPTYLLGGMGDDTISGGEGPDIITGGGGRDLIFGNGGADRLNGSGGSDKIFGYSGSDRLFGGDGNDTLDGGYGIDWLRGEAGNDVLLARDKSRDVLIGGDPFDGFTDYAQVDSLWDELHEIDTLLL